MKISSEKTQVITPNETEIWTINDLRNNDSFSIRNVNTYQYLGIQQYKSLLQTSDQRAKLALKKLQGYRKLLSLKKFHMADTIDYYLVSWKNVLQPGALYAAEVLPWSTNQINEITRN